MRHIYFTFVLIVFGSCQPTTEAPSPVPLEEHQPSIVYAWSDVILEATARDTERYSPRPTITSRCIALVCVAMFDAWTVFDEKATPVYSAKLQKVSPSERSEQNKAAAVSYAAYHALKLVYPADSVFFQSKMRSLGYDPESTDSLAGIGIAAVQAMFDARLFDGANQWSEELLIDLPSYGDYTFYKPVNSASVNRQVDRWQPKTFVFSPDSTFAPDCLTPHWGHVKPIGLQRADSYRSQPPPALGSEQLRAELAEVVALQGKLSKEDIALVEFMRDGPQSVQQAGHWMKFAQVVSKRDRHDLDADIKLFFLCQIVAMDAFIACWDTKMHYDYARPYALIHELFADSTIIGWGGPGKGFRAMQGKEWRPYSPESFLCPPFPSYVSGHSTVSAACSEALRLFTGSDTFGLEVQWLPGSLTDPGFAQDSVLLQFKTFSQTAEMAGYSRVLGGYHIACENEEGLLLGRKVAYEDWQFYQRHVNQQ